jgi:prolyl oligopeptidase
MQKLACFLPLLAVAGCSHSPLAYPPTRQVEQWDTYHGTPVPDPYRWLEDANAPETQAWVEAQNQVTFAYLSRLPAREAIRSRLKELWNYERFGIPFRQGNRYFLSRNDGLQNQSVLYTLESLDAEPRVLLDPNTLSADGTVALSGVSVSEDGRLMAYGISASGSDWQEWKVRDVASGKDLPDHLKWIKFSGTSWRRNGEGFFYSRYDEPKAGEAFQGVNYHQKLYYHRIGTPQSEDRLVYHREDQKEWSFSGSVTEDDRYLVISIGQGTDTRNRVYYKDLQADGPVVPLLDRFDASYDLIGNSGPVFWFQTDLEAPRGRVIAVDLRNPQPERWTEVIPQAAETLRSVRFVGGRFIASYLKDARSQVKLFRTDGRLERELELPGLGSASGFGGKSTDRETFYSFTSYTEPGAIYRYDLESGKIEVFRKPAVRFNASDYETRQVFYTSRDGTRIPMFISHRKGLVLDGSHPTYLYGYGGFNISLTPGFSVSMLAWMEMGGVYAVANLRGGGEYGEEWHQAGMKTRKQNVFDDFIAAAEYLIAERYTRPDRLAIAGGSNGGLLVGACITQRPELFGAALPAVGVMDMLRFHKFTIGWAWVSDYGSADHPEEFSALRAYSPLHNIRRGAAYPPTLITTADHDDRVVPGHSFKFAAALQAAQSGPAPILIRIDTKAGHGAGKPTSKQIEETADRFAFLHHVLKMKPLR